MISIIAQQLLVVMNTIRVVIERLAVNGKVATATVLGSILTSSDAAEYEARQMTQC